MARRRARRRRSGSSRLVIALNIALVLALLTGAGGLVFLNLRFADVERIDLDETLDEEPSGRGAQNYLLVGTDSAVGLDPDDPVTNGRDGLGILSDTIMLLRVDPDSPRAPLLSFPRDLYLPIPGVGEQKINSALAAGGQEALIGAVQENFGVPVHHYVEMDFLGFKELVRALDGIPIFFDKPLRDPATGLYVPRRGCITLDPDQALAYARSRHLEYLEDGQWIEDLSSDFGRVARQQDFVRRAIQRAITQGVRNPLTLGPLMDVAIGAVQIDGALSADDFVTLGTHFRNFGPDTLQTMTLDVTDDFADGQSILRVQDTEANDQRLDVFRGIGGAGTDQAPNISVEVLNGTGTSGQAGEVSEGLDLLGFDTSPGTGDAENAEFDRTLVRYTAGNEAIAQFVAAQLEAGADLEEVDGIDGADVIVVTGSDDEGVRTDLQPPPTPIGGSGGGSGGGGVTPTTGPEPIGEVPTEPTGAAACGP